MAGREISAKKYVVKLSAEEREQLEAMICAGKHPAQSLTKARILLKANVSEAGEGWIDSAISAALDTSINNIGRTRRRLVEEGMAAALTRKYSPNSARPRIFYGATEAKIDRRDLLAGEALESKGQRGQPIAAEPASHPSISASTCAAAERAKLSRS